MPALLLCFHLTANAFERQWHSLLVYSGCLIPRSTLVFSLKALPIEKTERTRAERKRRKKNRKLRNSARNLRIVFSFSFFVSVAFYLSQSVTFTLRPSSSIHSLNRRASFYFYLKHVLKSKQVRRTRKRTLSS
jgi:hypothetical protein